MQNSTDIFAAGQTAEVVLHVNAIVEITKPDHNVVSAKHAALNRHTMRHRVLNISLQDVMVDAQGPFGFQVGCKLASLPCRKRVCE